MIANVPWPSWQQALGFALVTLALSVGVRRLRPNRATEIAHPALYELAVIGGLYALWQSAKKLPLHQSDGAVERARDIVDLQEAMLLPSELGVNRLALDHDWLGWISSAYYAGMHVPSIIAFLVWLFWRHRAAYTTWRNVLAVTTAGCIVLRFWRVAPPRFLPDLGFVDVTVRHGMDVYGPVGTGISGQFVAMPSIHVAWAGVIAVAVLVESTSRWRWLVAAHLPVTVFVVAATGHHWWLDGIVALIVVALAAITVIGTTRVVTTLRRRQADQGGREADGAEPAEPETTEPLALDPG